MTLKNKLYLLLILCIPVSSFAQPTNSQASKVKESDYVFGAYEKNYDSLLYNLISTKAIKLHQKKYLTPGTIAQTDYSINIPDSVFIRRLNKIPSVIPLTYNDVVRNYIEFYVKRYRQTVNLMLTLSEYYFPIFEEIFDQRGVPLEIKYLAIIESALNPIAISRAGASGLWQFMYGTGKGYGLEINSLVDERRDPIKSTVAAANYLKDLYGIYNDWALALAAYNCGPGNVNKAIKRANGKRSYWEIYDYLPLETRGYVPGYIAATYIMNYYKQHGIQATSVDLPIITDTVWVNEDIHMEQINGVIGVSMEQLRSLNPQYKSDIIPGKSKAYSLILPMKSAVEFTGMYDSILNYKTNEYFQSAVASNSNAVGIEKVYHTVKKGETWITIGARYGVSVADLKKWNGRVSKKVAIGTRLVVYKYNPLSVSQTTTATVATPVVKTVQENPAKPVAPKKTETYTVKAGDSLYKIAQNNNLTLDKLLELNGLNLKSRILPGQKLQVQ